MAERRGDRPRARGGARAVVCGDVINDVLVRPLAGIAVDSDTPAEVVCAPGGSAANQAAWLAYLGVDVVFAGRAGAADADFHRAELTRFGVRPVLAADPSEETGSIVIFIAPDGERSMVTDRGANLRLDRSDVPDDLLDGAALLHLTGYSFFWPGPRAVVLALLGAARERSVPVTIDPGSAAFLAELPHGAFAGWTRGALVCFPNFAEAAVLSGLPPGSAPEAMAVRLTADYPVVAVKLGADGVLLAWRSEGEPATIRVPAVTATVLDTTGAGDAFCAGFLASWLERRQPGERRPEGAALVAAARSGVAVAGLAVAAVGGRPAIADAPR